MLVSQVSERLFSPFSDLDLCNLEEAALEGIPPPELALFEPEESTPEKSSEDQKERTKAEQRRINNRESARRSREAKKLQLQQLESHAHILSQIPDLLKDVNKEVLDPDLADEISTLEKLSANKPVEAQSLLQQLFKKVLEENCALRTGIQTFRTQLHDLHTSN